MSSLSSRTASTGLFNARLFFRKHNKFDLLITCCLFLIVILCAVLHVRIASADDLINLVQLQRNSSNILLILDTGNPVDFELLYLESKSRLFLNLYHPDYYEDLHSFFNNISKRVYKPCILDIQVKRYSDSTQLIIDIDEGLLINIDKVKSDIENQHKLILDVFSDPPIKNKCSAVSIINIAKNSDTKKNGVVSNRAKENSKKKKKPSALKFSVYAMYDYMSGIGKPNNWNKVLKKESDKELRRFKITAKGIIGHWNYVLGLNLKDIFEPKHKLKLYRGYVGYRTLRALRISVGLQPEPFGVDKSTSSNYLTFMERSLPIVFMPQDNLGLRLSWSPSSYYFADAGIYKERTWPEGGDIKKAFTGHVGFTPINSKRRLFYAGLSISNRKPKKDILRFRSRPEAHLTKKLYDSGKIAGVETIRLINFETAIVYGSLSLQGEYLRSTLLFNGQLQDKTNTSYYIYSSVFLTGESRKYSRGNFGRVKPRKKIGKGIGAWEIGIRQSKIDDYNNQQLNVTTYGINWYLNKHSRLMFNVINATHTQDSVIRHGSLFEIRFQLKM